MIFDTLHESAQRGELLLLDGGLCHWHLRRDGQLTIREIISTSKGAGARMLRRLHWQIGAANLFAKCPADLASNAWYQKRGFKADGTSQTKTGKTLNHWRYEVDSHKPILNLENQIELIYCADGNKRLMEIALDAGFLPGAQLPNTIYYRPYFTDQDWRNPDRAKYMAAIAQHRPRLATVLDFERPDQYADVMAWAEEAAQHAGEIIIIPKVVGSIKDIPETIAGKPVRLGYSVPTKFAGTTVPLAEFGQRPVHLLGGSPDVQMKLARTLNVKSADANYMQKMATAYCQYFTTNQGNKFKNKKWPTLQESDGGWENDAPYEAFRRSCVTIMKAWRESLALPRLEVPQAQPALIGLEVAV
jgi:hypothetical protein